MNARNIQQHAPFRILLIGDKCTDVYQFGTVDRLSPEAPVPIFVPTHKEEREGMAGNVYANLVNLGCTVDIVCGHPSKKTRLIDIRSKQQILRIDQDEKSIPVVNVNPDGYDAIVISDYDKGIVSYELVEGLVKSCSLPIFIDTKKKDLRCFNGCYVKINDLEYNTALTLPSNNWLITTKGKNGTLYNGKMYPASNAGDVTDVTGAGDTFLAALAVQYLKTRNIENAIEFANKAAAVTVQHLGVYAPTLEEIQ